MKIYKNFMMKRTTILMLAFSLLKSYAYGNNPVNVTIKQQSITLKQFFSELETQTSYTFNYGEDILNDQKTYDVKYTNKKVETAVKDISARANLTYKLSNRVFLIRKNNNIQEKYQQSELRGLVVDKETSEPLIGVSIVVSGSNNGLMTDFSGQFVVKNIDYPVTITISYLGYKTISKTFNKPESNLVISLEPSSEMLDAVVVTALGISRKEKSLGYSVGKVAGESVTETKRANLSNALSAKMPGVQVTNVSSDPASSSLITIRGESSISGDNQPLFVVDGIPVSSNNRNADSSGGAYVDYGNTAMDISPDDVQDITVLKGAAAALYGSRAANGVILITTKNGKNKKQGIGVSYNASIKFDTPWLFPEFQNEFAAGSDIMAVNGDGVPIATGAASWGPRITPGAMAVQNYPGGETRVGELKAYPDRHKDFYEVGQTLTNNVSVTGNYDKGSFRLSYNNLQNTGIVPNTDYKKNSYNLNTTYKIKDNLSVSAMANFSVAESDNRPGQGKSDDDNTTEVVYRLTPNTNVNDYRSYWEDGLDGLQQKELEGADNPFFTAYEQLNEFKRTRLFGKLQLNYKINPTMSLQLRSGIDTYQEQRVTKRAFSSNEFPTGAYGNNIIGFTETNVDALFTYTPKLDEMFDLTVSLGVNRMDQNQYYNKANTRKLEIPNYYNISNAAAGTVNNTDGISKKRINSLYSLASLSFDDMLFLDLSARNDWSSTLPEEHNSYFYPAASLSFLFSDAFNMKSNVFSFGKLRLSWSEVGNDTSPYQLTNTYGFSDWGDLKLASNSQNLKNNNLKPEKTRNLEVGFDVRWFKNRLGLDVALYKSNTYNQIINLPIAISSGGTSKVINAGEIQNQGVEVALHAIPLKTQDFKWMLNANFSKNKNKVISLHQDIESYQVASTTGIYQLLEVGGSMGDFYDKRTPLTVKEGEHAGRYILEDGMFIRDNTWTKTGSRNPDFTVGFTNTLTYKNFRMNFTLDWRQGGQFYNYTAKNLMSDGRTTFTTQFRDAQSGGVSFVQDGQTRVDGGIIPGIVANGDGTYSENTVALASEPYYGELWDYEEFHMSTATYVKLREMSIGYTFNKLKPFDRLSIDLIGNDLLSWFAYKIKRNRDGYITGDYDKGYDPETQNYLSNSGSLGITQGVAAWQLPATRSFGIKLSANF
ncbi:TonB-linked SusC/RagA family outer membrane protein [Wenyingzhuangia heitensis]|uniref:TonB-linked SusC/RagA family outer membrane protein n=1 Tax=Wenyingzhuangia heitensis TaxID=1487859 RepID=A0ABX0U6H5_9FLAO|nr:SusC/RagA family TonB-linked outer membrane protein [Wenyingzhuangia heitensis]NIJ44363.1 TonB-linked SusC/RagA family outer membrane protein [Wenyingzhuangia heitensis]